MLGAKAIDGKRVRILVDLETKTAKVKAGEEGRFTKDGVVLCHFTTDDGRRFNVGAPVQE